MNLESELNGWRNKTVGCVGSYDHYRDQRNRFDW